MIKYRLADDYCVILSPHHLLEEHDDSDILHHHVVVNPILSVNRALTFNVFYHHSFKDDSDSDSAMMPETSLLWPKAYARFLFLNKFEPYSHLLVIHNEL